MPVLVISGNNYEVYADAAYADAYLAADVARSSVWAALTNDDKSKALVSSTRLLLRQNWLSGEAPATDAAPDAVKDATCLLAADIAVKPTLADTGSTSSNVKSVGAGSARVEFFAPVPGAPLPAAVWTLLRELLGAPSDGDASLDSTAYGSSCQPSRFDPTDYTLVGNTYWPGSY